MRRLGIAVVLACVIAWPMAAQQPTFSSKREVVRVDVLVTDHGAPVRGLTAGDFEVLDSGVAQQVELVTFEQLPLSIVLALDGSSSISADQLTDLRDAGRAVLAGMRTNDEAALLTFSDAVRVRERPTTSVARLRAALDALAPAPRQSSGGTALVDACYAAMTLADADVARALLIAFTDGIDTSSWLSAQHVLQGARRSNVVAYAVSTSKLPDGSFLRDLGDATGGSSLEIASTRDVRATFVRILDEFRQRYLVSYTPTDVPGGGWHPLTVRVRGRRLDVKARGGYAR